MPNKITHDQVPNEVLSAVSNALEQYAEDFPAEYWKLRQYVTNHVVSHTNKSWEFSEDYRHGVTPGHQLVYHLVATIAANCHDLKAVDRYFEAAAGDLLSA